MIRTAMIAVAAGTLLSCAAAGPNDEQGETPTEAPLTFEEFLAETYQEPWIDGHFIVNGDTPIADLKALEAFYNEMRNERLIVNRSGGVDTKWNDAQKLNLTYCISNNFGANKATMVAAMRAATDLGWETRANVNFIYASAQDGSCTTSNTSVLFNVRQVSGQPYLARAFFPGDARRSREILVDTSAFQPSGWPLANIIAHEVGHTLGFRHEHTRPESGACFEDNSWRPLTPYDSASIMHYPQCNGSSEDLSFSTLDGTGAAAIYGAPSGSNTPPPTGTERTDNRTGQLSQGQLVTFPAYTVKPGTTFAADMTGSGDPDLYVRFGSAPTASTYACRPYLDGATESCALTVPTGATTAYVQVRGYTASSYAVGVRYTAP